jgi:Na+/melibiose symporter-like transporter
MERGYVLTTTTKALYCLPQITSNILNGFIGGHITRFFVQDLCKYSSMGTTCLTTRRYGTLSSIIGSLGLFLDLFISSFVDASSRKHQKGHAIPLIATTAPIACLINITLFNVQYLQSFIQNVALLVHLKASPMLTLSCLFIILSVVKNITPLALAYHSLGPALTRNCSQNDRNSLFAYKHVFGLLGNMLGGFLPSIAIYLLGNENEVYWQSVYVTLASIVDLLAYWLLCLHLRNHINSITSPEMHREEPAVSKNEYNIIPNMKQAFSNRAFKVILLLFIYEASRGILWGGLFPFYLSQVCFLCCMNL